jgi:hypothetical protein
VGQLFAHSQPSDIVSELVRFHSSSGIGDRNHNNPAIQQRVQFFGVSLASNDRVGLKSQSSVQSDSDGVGAGGDRQLRDTVRVQCAELAFSINLAQKYLGFSADVRVLAGRDNLQRVSVLLDSVRKCSI